jgi:muramoyltetrapeptide carboxypeptidase LdcA involved in peptidoglycan recycling
MIPLVRSARETKTGFVGKSDFTAPLDSSFSASGIHPIRGSMAYSIAGFGLILI